MNDEFQKYEIPGWLLAEIATMAKISALKVKQLAQEVNSPIFNNI